jgi:hypothetical protein
LSAHEFAMRAPFQLGCRHYSHKLLLTNTVLAMFCHHFWPPASWASNPLEPSIHIQHCKMKHGKKNDLPPTFFTITVPRPSSRLRNSKQIFEETLGEPITHHGFSLYVFSPKKHAWQIFSKSTKNFRKICWCGTIGHVFLDQNVCQQSSSAGNGRLRFQQGNGP